MSNVVQFPPKLVCTNLYKTCTYDDCPLKTAYTQLGATAYLGNCSRYALRRLADMQIASLTDNPNVK